MIKYVVNSYYKWHSEFVMMLDTDRTHTAFNSLKEASNYAQNKYSYDDVKEMNVVDDYTVYYLFKDGSRVCVKIEPVHINVSFWDLFK